jgi:hypothetical protein
MHFSQAFWWALNIEWDTDWDLHDMIFEVSKEDIQWNSSWKLSSMAVGQFGIRGIMRYSIKSDPLSQHVLLNSKYIAQLLYIGIGLV